MDTIAEAILHFTRTRPQWGMLLLRVVFGVILLQQFHDVFFRRSREAQILFRHISGWPARLARVGALATGAIGVCFIVGLAARPLALLIAAIIVSAMVVERAQTRTVFEKRMKSLLLAISLLFFLSGAGRVSADWYLSSALEAKYPDPAIHAYIHAEKSHDVAWWW